MAYRFRGPAVSGLLALLCACPSVAAAPDTSLASSEAAQRCAAGSPEAGLELLRAAGLLQPGVAATRPDYGATIPVIADCYAAQGLTRSAVQSLQAGLRRAEGAQAPDIAARLHEKLGRVLLQSGASLAAQREFELALDGLPAADARRPGLLLALAASSAVTGGGEPGTTASLYRDAISVAREQDDQPVLVDAQLGLYRALREAQKPDTSLLASSRELLQRMPPQPAKPALTGALGTLYARLDEDTSASGNRATAIALLSESAIVTIVGVRSSLGGA